MSKKRAFIRYTKKGKIVPGSLILTNGTYPKDGTYQEVNTDLCCDFDPRILVKIIGVTFSNKPYDGNDLASPSGFPSITGVLPHDIGRVGIDFNNDPFQFGARFVSINIGNHIGIYPNDAFLLTGELAYKYKFDPFAICGYANITP